MKKRIALGVAGVWWGGKNHVLLEPYSLGVADRPTSLIRPCSSSTSSSRRPRQTGSRKRVLASPVHWKTGDGERGENPRLLACLRLGTCRAPTRRCGPLRAPPHRIPRYLQAGTYLRVVRGAEVALHGRDRPDPPPVASPVFPGLDAQEEMQFQALASRSDGTSWLRMPLCFDLDAPEGWWRQVVLPRLETKREHLEVQENHLQEARDPAAANVSFIEQVCISFCHFMRFNGGTRSFEHLDGASASSHGQGYRGQPPGRLHGEALPGAAGSSDIRSCGGPCARWAVSQTLGRAVMELNSSGSGQHSTCARTDTNPQRRSLTSTVRSPRGSC